MSSIVFICIDAYSLFDLNKDLNKLYNDRIQYEQQIMRPGKMLKESKENWKES
jgi:hypothetical protein